MLYVPYSRHVAAVGFISEPAGATLPQLFLEAFQFIQQDGALCADVINILTRMMSLQLAM